MAVLNAGTGWQHCLQQVTQHLVEVGLGGAEGLGILDIHTFYLVTTPSPHTPRLAFLVHCSSYLGQIDLSFFISKMGAVVIIARTHQACAWSRPCVWVFYIPQFLEVEIMPAATLE